MKVTLAAAAALASIGASFGAQTSIPELLDTVDGSRVTSARGWGRLTWERRRRNEIKEVFEREEFGRRPVERPRDLAFEVEKVDPSALGGKAVMKRVRISWTGTSGAGSFTATAYIPKIIPAAPAYVHIVIGDRRRMDVGGEKASEYWPVDRIIRRGYATVGFWSGDLAEDDPAKCFESGVFKTYMKPGEKRAADAWGALSAWAWGASRVMDWIVTEPLIDASKVAVIGHSRGGKAALWAGATDERFRLTCANNSGAGGAKLYHFDAPGSETVADLVKRFPHWFAPNYARWAGREREMPFDQHWLLALMAPRLLAVGSATEDAWAGPRAEFAACLAANPAWHIFNLTGCDFSCFPEPNNLNLGGPIGYHLRAGKHGLTRFDWNRYMDYSDYQCFRTAQGEIARPENVPDLLTAPDGTRAATKEEWEKKCRPAILDFYSRQVYGVAPVGRPKDIVFEKLMPDEEVFGKLGIKKRYLAKFKGPCGEGNFHITAYIPAAAKSRPAPGFVYINFWEYETCENSQSLTRMPLDNILSRGFALVHYEIMDYAPDYSDMRPRDPEWWRKDVYGVFGGRDAKERGEAWGAITAWAWGAGRTLDWIETEPMLDAKHFGVVGQSRGGKTALWAAASDPRWGMACVNCSGTLGARLNHIDQPEGEQVSKLYMVQKFWFGENLGKIMEDDRDWPFDTHQLIACVAPRLVQICAGSEDGYSSPDGMFEAARLASPVWGLYGMTGLGDHDRIPVSGESYQDGAVGFFLHKGGHGLFPVDWNRYMDMADRHNWRGTK
ncbi:MAG: hypothetical protein J6T01_01755 [Kiritimatiellae bacterium]|nr:hypothetical protein [Kiritimatiellia bacterium]